ncbi:MAG: glutathione S-transferase family protein [Hoeflea sp.]|uniref:glutathione S-transferase family protein n=1 Tax=Hoeflea sp. TaxID=1940281 RepID=UPI001D258D47|nr:glutathione S-transferase family protein [Hoeflea sp.]MBU4530424.1 glutathione S-transferase family protein [Alphaproteobacteria bacterium]MBU4545211.1 glutathione S-transferase family protein [Alphaproteobacteria bacterium]MBU4549589.1 glutathione S-transferase family protein [Alphaproteobacteria bacterium]MBV1722014.1 glutathione S-transferase family protein [Hoeflea sp.]MBV1761364.1 glutathione S-transferase family protein [Hoeflea sp.]
MSAPTLVTLIGADYSVYSRICRLALHLKGLPHEFEMLDVFAEDGPARARQAGHPFGKIPVLRHGDLTLFETLAITRYIDETFDGPALQPTDPAGRARMNQIISIVDTSAYPVLVWGLHVPKSESREPDPGMLDKGRAVLDVLEALTQGPWLCGTMPTLADAYLAACMDYILESAAGNHVANHCPRIQDWWSRAKALPDVD